MKDKEKLRNRVIYTRVTEREFHAIMHAAARLDMSFSEFVRRGAMFLVQKEFDKN